MNGVSQQYRLGKVKRVKASDADDPVLTQFLGFLASDRTQNPDRLQVLDEAPAHRLQSLVGDVAVDLDSALSADNE